MITVLFICHGNICRSPMAEFVFKDMVARRGLSNAFAIASAATSTDALGSDTHRGTQEALQAAGIPFSRRAAVQLTNKDYDLYDYIIGMDNRNLDNMRRITGHRAGGKLCRLLDYTSRPRDIADPWYSGNFDLTYAEVSEGCEALLEFILKARQP